MQSMFTIHQGRPEDITMREDVSVNDLLRVDEFSQCFMPYLFLYRV